MTGALDLLCDFIEQPQQAARAAAERRPILLGFASLVASGASLFLAQAVTHRFLPAGSGPISLGLVCVWSVVNGFLMAGVLHLIADIWGRSGSAGGLFVLMGLSELVWALVLPAALLLRTLGLDSWLTLLPLLTAAGWLSMRLKARSIKDIYGLTPARAWSLLLLPYLAASLLVLLAFAGVIVGTAVSIVKLVS